MSFVATPDDVQRWLVKLGSPFDLLIREDVHQRCFRKVNLLDLNQFSDSAKEYDSISYWVSMRSLLEHYSIPDVYKVGEANFQEVMIFNGFIFVGFCQWQGKLRVSTLSSVYTVFGYDGRTFESEFAKTQFQRLKRIVKKDLVYHTLHARPSINYRKGSPPSKINPTVTATEAAIEAYQDGCNWLPGPKKEVKPRTRKKNI